MSDDYKWLDRTLRRHAGCGLGKSTGGTPKTESFYDEPATPGGKTYYTTITKHYDSNGKVDNIEYEVLEQDPNTPPPGRIVFRGKATYPKGSNGDLLPEYEEFERPGPDGGPGTKTEHYYEYVPADPPAPPGTMKRRLKNTKVLKWNPDRGAYDPFPSLARIMRPDAFGEDATLVAMKDGEIIEGAEIAIVFNGAALL